MKPLNAGTQEPGNSGTSEPRNPGTPELRNPGTFLVAALLVLALATGISSAPAPVETGGNATMYLGAYPDRILIIDEATAKVTGQIPTKTGLPTMMVLSQNRQRFYVLNSFYEDVEIVDIASRKVVDAFRLTEGARRVRIGAFQVDPSERYMVLTSRAFTRQLDHFEVEPSQLVLYDLKQHKVARVIPWPDGEEKDPRGWAFGGNFLYSPDGKFLYMFSDDVLVFETTEYRLVDKWQLSRSVEAGFGGMHFGSIDVLNEEPGYFTGLFTTEDPVEHRRVLGVARVNLVAKSVEFTAVSPANDRIGSFALAPGRKIAYGLLDRIGHYEFWTFNLEKPSLMSRTELPGRPRMSMKVSSNGKLLYIYEAGNTIDIYDAASYKHLRTVTLDADMTTDLFILPPPGS